MDRTGRLKPNHQPAPGKMKEYNDYKATQSLSGNVCAIKKSNKKTTVIKRNFID